jgi:hypothetical protein
MKRYALLLALTGIAMAADSTRTYVGVVHDNQPVNPHNATQCVLIKGPRFTLQTKTEAWVLSDETAAAKYAGQKVSVTGAVTDGNKLRVTAIHPIK